ncbi:unnamed protein product (macronuclear) [Paramecium tetraurelia]|uniref:YCII-related domain-containing protein n=1 Tax=Paramecium tetraurelia TaxID=5888 RepID=A0E0R0_PARTE|nr:uncharacterized protein GSPATT00022045001 [Paramecium tetraurelia]CAK88877.1 unnamed protein product [Paramecium tetraurelia]|eukprot:XP_001456274.1 hypothetical protein (macronuclear) [Paramecium tetraurelia strain d4-2]
MITNQIKYSFALYSKYFLVSQQYNQDMYYHRIPLRSEHENQLQKLISKGAQIIGGAQFPYNGAYYIINTEDDNNIKSFINNDPYTQNNLAKTTYEQIYPQIDNFDQLSQLYSFK